MRKKKWGKVRLQSIHGGARTSTPKRGWLSKVDDLVSSRGWIVGNGPLDIALLS